MIICSVRDDGTGYPIDEPDRTVRGALRKPSLHPCSEPVFTRSLTILAHLTLTRVRTPRIRRPATSAWRKEAITPMHTPALLRARSGARSSRCPLINQYPSSGCTGMYAHSSFGSVILQLDSLSRTWCPRRAPDRYGPYLSGGENVMFLSLVEPQIFEDSLEYGQWLHELHSSVLRSILRRLQLISMQV